MSLLIRTTIGYSLPVPDSLVVKCRFMIADPMVGGSKGDLVLLKLYIFKLA
jgi:hypothetical protein